MRYLGVVVLIVLIGCRTKAQREKDDQVNAQIAAEAADASAQHKADVEKLFRDTCKIKAPKPIFTVEDDDLRERCRDMVRESLKVPGSGDFPPKSEDQAEFKTDDGCNRLYQSHVDAQNAFGVKVRTEFTCKYDPRTGLYSVK